MKQVIMIALVLLCIIATGFAQGKTPIAVTKAFSQKFPGATNIKWDKENAHEYEAEFKLNSLNCSANFSDKGDWLETETEVLFAQLPLKVQNAFTTSHKGAKVKAAAKIETLKGIIKYEIEIRQGLKTAELVYTADGKETKE